MKELQRNIITARKQTRFGARYFRSVCQEFCPRGGAGGVVSQHALQVVSQHALQVVSQHALQVSRGMVSQHALQVSGPTPKGEVEGSGLGGLQTHTQGGKLRGLAWGVSRPTPGWGFSPSQHSGGSPGPHPGGVSRPIHGGGGIPVCAEADTSPHQTATAAGGMHPTGMHPCGKNNQPTIFVLKL